ncbi:MAG: hypothetical protein N3G21_10495 [Candidatus Hydrogenedentes bacterium]|nr:hypothetical protein [Candidatus Hydrogenedentota bacterium]
MRLLFLVIVVVFSISLSLVSILPLVLSEDIFTSTESNQVFFNKALSHIKKIDRYQKICHELNKDFDSSQIKDNELDDISPLLRELELILIYQNYLIAKNNYISVREKALRREINPVEISSHYREYERAKLYLDRAIEQYPEVLKIIGSSLR